MSNPSAAPDAPTRDEELPEPLHFTLQIISPSMGVSGPLSFPLLPATTSVKDLKAKIRDALPSKPVDESQRLIHRGRMLARETETMLEIFGQETVSSSTSSVRSPVLSTICSACQPRITNTSSGLASNSYRCTHHSIACHDSSRGCWPTNPQPNESNEPNSATVPTVTVYASGESHPRHACSTASSRVSTCTATPGATPSRAHPECYGSATATLAKGNAAITSGDGIV